jgi:hypothetical protein
MTQKSVSIAKDAEQYGREYYAFDDDIVWITRDGNAICYANDVAHCTTQEWRMAQ